MKPRKNTVLILLLALLLTAFAVGMAQTPAQGDQEKSKACCAMESCCCNGGSCGDSCEMKTKDGKDHASCCGDTCQMKKHDAKNHGAKGECCKAKHKDKAKQKTANT